jgi:hypothetical protein
VAEGGEGVEEALVEEPVEPVDLLLLHLLLHDSYSFLSVPYFQVH